MDNKIIITAAITGSVHIPTMSDALPITPDEIVEDAVKAHEAGAAIAHIHVRNPETGEPSADTDLFVEVHQKIKASPATAAQHCSTAAPRPGLYNHRSPGS